MKIRLYKWLKWFDLQWLFTTCPIHKQRLERFWQYGSPISGPDVWKVCQKCEQMPDGLKLKVQ